MIAASRGYDNIVKMLLNAGATADAEDITGKNALDYARASKDENTINLLTPLIKPKKAPIQTKIATEVPIAVASQEKVVTPASALTPAEKAVVPLVKAPALKGTLFLKPQFEKAPEKALAIKPIVEEKPAPANKELKPTNAILPIEKNAAPIIKAPTALKGTLLLKPQLKKAPEKALAAKPVAKEKNGGAGKTLLMKAVKKGDIREIKQLLKNKATLNAQNDKGETALAIASRWGNDARIVKMLLNAGANPNTTEATGLTPLQTAVISGNVDKARLLLDNGAQVNAQDTYRGRTPLNWVVRMTTGAKLKIAAQMPVERSVELLTLLLSRGADPSIADDRKRTPLNWARSLNMTPLVKVLENGGG
jgi:ankyrin repeat protein